MPRLHEESPASTPTSILYISAALISGPRSAPDLRTALEQAGWDRLGRGVHAYLIRATAMGRIERAPDRDPLTGSILWRLTRTGREAFVRSMYTLYTLLPAQEPPWSTT